MKILPYELRAMLKKVSFYDAIILIISGIITYKLFHNYYVYILIGIVVALISFVLNSILTSYSVNNDNMTFVMPMGTFLRIILVCIIALVIIKYNTNNIFPFIIGYSLHFLGIILYSLNIKK